MDQQFGTQLGNRDFFIRRWEQEYPAFVDVCRALLPERLDYRPHPGSRSAGELVALLVSGEKSCVDLCETGRGALNIGLRWHASSGATALQEMIAEYETYHRALAEKLNRLDDAIWNRPAWLTRGEQEIILRDSVGGLLWIWLFDAVHHRGQLSTYIRPMGSKVPSIYGPSADSPARE
jgi:DinB family